MSGTWLLQAVAAGPVDRLLSALDTLLDYGNPVAWATVAGRVDVPEVAAVAAAERLLADPAGRFELERLTARDRPHDGVQVVLARTLTDRLAVFARHLTAPAAAVAVLDRALTRPDIADPAAAEQYQLAAVVALAQLAGRAELEPVLTSAGFEDKVARTLAGIPGGATADVVFRRLLHAVFAWARVNPAWVCTLTVTLGDSYLLTQAVVNSWADDRVRSAYVASVATSEPADGYHADLPATTLRMVWPLLTVTDRCIVRGLVARAVAAEDDWEFRTLVSLTGATASTPTETQECLDVDAAVLRRLEDPEIVAHEAAGWALEHAVPPRVWLTARAGDRTFRRLMVLGDVDGLGFLDGTDLVEALTWGLDQAEGWAGLARAASTLESAGVRDRCCGSPLLWQLPWSALVRWADVDSRVAATLEARMVPLLTDPTQAGCLLRLLDGPAATAVPAEQLLVAAAVASDCSR